MDTLFIRRDNFVGITDKYAYPITQQNALEAAKKGDSFFDITGALTETFRDFATQRINRYRTNWKFFNDWQYFHEYDPDGIRKLVINYCSKSVNLGADWIVGGGYKFISTEGNEEVAGVIDDVFESNGKAELLWKAAQFGGVTGDVFFYVTVEQNDIDGNELPKEQWKVRINPLNPAHVFPVWHQNKPDQMASCLIQFPTMMDNGSISLFSLQITPQYFQAWVDYEDQGRKPNPFGRVNVVHVPHEVIANSLFGIGDIDIIGALNQELNVTADTIRRVIKYHGEPTTIIFGAQVSELQRGSGKVWSGLPKDGKVENLSLNADLATIFQWYKQIKEEISVKAEIPMFVLTGGDSMRVSNTSGIAMQMLFEPLISRTTRRQRNYRKALVEVAKLVLIAHRDVLGDDVAALADNPEQLFNLGVEFESPLPVDETAELNLAVGKVQNGFWSQAEAIRRISGVSSLRRLSLELAADKRDKLANTLETARATQGQTPIFSSVFLSSPFLSEDLMDTASAQNDAQPDVPPPPAPVVVAPAAPTATAK
jgi:hypothetical protein